MPDTKPLSKPYLPQELPDRSLVVDVYHLMPKWEDVRHFYESPAPGVENSFFNFFDSWACMAPNSENGSSVPIDQQPELPRRIPLLTGEDVGIQVEGNLDTLMAEALLHDVWRYAG